MSAIRTSRRSSRPPQSPYSRPAAKKSSWSITGFLKSLVPWSSTETTVEDEYAIQEDIPTDLESPAPSLTARGHQLEREINENEPLSRETPPPPPRPPARPTLFDPTSPERDLQTVSAHIRESLDRKDVEKLCAMLQGGSSEEVVQPFRFSATPSTPGRADSPLLGVNASLGFTFGVSASVPASTSSSRKMLNRNPNGVYRWQGGGSAKTPRSRNRYSSPAFGPSRSASDRFALKDTQTGTETPRTDTKRRKLAEDVEPSSALDKSGSIINDSTPKPSRRASAPDPSPTRIKQALPFPVSAGSPMAPRTTNSLSSNTTSSQTTSRLRVPPVAQKLTAPVVPSPLRQTWSGASPPSQSALPTTLSPPKQTKAANYMTELIKEVTPPKRPDLSNPYQIASPLGKVGSAPKGRVGRRVRATGRPTTPAKKNEKSTVSEKVFSPQAIIEATLPKGSKRSRPPKHLEKSLSFDSESSLSEESSQAGSSNRKRYTPSVEEETDEEDEDAKRAVKKSKSQLSVHGVPTTVERSKSDSSDIVVEEVEVVDANATLEKPQSALLPSSSSTSTARPGRPAFPGSKSTSAPKEPSKLRYSYQPELTNSPASKNTPITAFPHTTSVSSLPISTSGSHPSSFFSTSNSTPTPVESTPEVTTPKVKIPEVTPQPAPFSFPSTREFKPSIAPMSSPFSFASAAAQAPAPVTTFSGDSSTLNPGQRAALKVQTSSLPAFMFSVNVRVPNLDSAHVKAAAEAKSIPISSLPTFDFSKGVTPPAMSSTSAKASSITPAISAPIVPFNWAGAGAKPPASSSGTTWTCSLCMLTNPMSATEQCEHCETKRPASTVTTQVASTPIAPKPSAPVVQQFNWAAAGMKPPVAAGDNWTCALCGLSNPASATDKCNTCDNPRA
ncbi:hypothetical protein C0992_003499 [Termitomyces sp. T32_za158]|nr:hypothetical protein C0992_003499 [Termitomyces sp. T32_za158]